MKTIKIKIHKLFVNNPLLGSIGYELLRLAGHGHGNLKPFLKNIRQKGFSPKSILDVGANRGEWSRNAKSIFKQADFFLIEPQQELKPFLDKFCAKFPGSKWFQAAVGSEIGELTLTVWPDFIGSSLLPATLKYSGKSLEKRRVPILTIDNLINEKEIPIPDLIKLDAEGFELEVLKGASGCFGHTEIFILEVSFFRFFPKLPLFDEVLNFMLKKGYVVYDIVDFKRSLLDGVLGRADVAFSKRDGLLRTKIINRFIKHQECSA